MYFLYWNDLHPVSHSCIAYVKLNYPKNPFTLYNVQSVFICNICQHCINQSTQKTKDIPAWRAYSLWLEWLDCAGHQMKIEQWLTPSPHQHGNTHFLWKLQNQFFLYQKSRKKDRMLFFFKKPLGKMLSAFKQSSYAYYNTEFQTMLEERIEGIFEYNNLLSFFPKIRQGNNFLSLHYRCRSICILFLVSIWRIYY